MPKQAGNSTFRRTSEKCITPRLGKEWCRIRFPGQAQNQPTAHLLSLVATLGRLGSFAPRGSKEVDGNTRTGVSKTLLL